MNVAYEIAIFPLRGIMTERTNWSLHRIGWIETNFILHEHLEVITIGRNCEADKQCLGECIIVDLYKWNCFLRHTFHRSANFSSALRATPRGISHRQTDLLDHKRSWIQR